MALSFAGIVVMNLSRGLALAAADLQGGLLMIGAAVLFATTSTLFKGALAKVRETEALYFQNAIGTVVFLPFLASELGGVGAADIAWASVYGLSVGLAAFWLFFFGMKRLSLFKYGALTYCEVPVAVLLGVLALGERLSPSQLAGALMVVVASFLAQRARSAGPAARDSST